MKTNDKKIIGVKYIGSWADHGGYGEANRQFIYALHKAGINLTTTRQQFVRETQDYGDPHLLAERLEGKPIDYNFVIIHLTPDLYLNHLEPDKYHIGHLFWETDRLPKGWAWYCNRLDEIWTGSESTKEAIIRSGVKVPVLVFPEPIQEVKPSDFEPYIIPNHKGFMFYSIFEWTERKNPKALLNAYWQEFEGDDNVSLLLKTYRDNYTMQMHQKIKSEIQELKMTSDVRKFPRILYSYELLTQEEMYKLHATGDCLVSASHGEGWGRPQAEAMLMGKPIISTNYGGINEYLNDSVAYVLPYELVPITEDPDRIYYTPDQNWAEVDFNELKAKMRFVYENRDKIETLGQAARKFIQTNFNPEKIGGAMKKRLLKIEEGI